tara:strand:+ start:1139 stop:1357 length:219 start_codon:yes stop_codon:yes gene_type:complete
MGVARGHCHQGVIKQGGVAAHLEDGILGLDALLDVRRHNLLDVLHVRRNVRRRLLLDRLDDLLVDERGALLD